MKNRNITRSEFLAWIGRAAAALCLGGVFTALVRRKATAAGTVWQIDPDKCTQCGQCATHCVLDQSAVKCFQEFRMCGYCNLCPGFFLPQPPALNEGAENQMCPTGAIQRRFVDDPYYEYQIDKDLCTACGKCVRGCRLFGNGSFYLQVSHDICKNCNECAIAAACPSDAFVRLPASSPYVDRLGGGRT
jgi:electron transport complex protein RnfB